MMDDDRDEEQEREFHKYCKQQNLFPIILVPVIFMMAVTWILVLINWIKNA